MEDYFNTIFEDVRHERTLILKLSLAELDILKQSKLTDHEIDIIIKNYNIIKNIALEKLYRQRNLKEIVTLDLLEKQISDPQMSTFPNLNNQRELLKKTRDDEIKNLKCQTEKHDYENIMKALKSDNGKNKKKYESLNIKKILLIITEILVGTGSAVG